MLEAIETGRAEFVNGSRLVYGLAPGAMRYLNLMGNKAFSLVLSALLDQRVKDTLCGTKVLERGDSLILGQGVPGALPMPDGIDMPQTPVRASPGGWEIDARGTVSGMLRLRGRDEDPVAVGRTGTPVTIMPGEMLLARIPCGAPSSASCRVMASTPPLPAQ